VNNPYEQYLEQSVLSATPLELVRMLYRCALDSIAQARTCLAEGDVAGRAKPVSKTCDVLTELLASLDHEQGGQISRDLAELYGYMQHRILQAHIEQSDSLFAEVANLMSNLLEGWQSIDQGEPCRDNVVVMQPAGEPALSGVNYRF
jgi:flagellar protein FliS